MSQISIPEKLYPGFDLLSNMKESTLNDLIEHLKNINVGIKFDDLAIELQKLFSAKESNLLVLTLISFAELFENNDRNFSELSKDLASSYVEVSTIELGSKTQTVLENNLLQIFNNANKLILTLKARGLAIENENTLIGFKMLTDIRPVFNLQVEENNRTAIIIHKIHLEYQKDSENNSIFISLDSDDLKTLLKTIERAVKKDQIVREDYKSTFKFLS